ncbi:hypothetical protein LOTGIDRAFT_237918 [Lottia gigantea]|uniref:TM2 domain-containing protein n=1 Tax=Lottia gigantea TaxID=225164 RepID=V4B519_LOTGI|nr:hypothetical protein LOTGIDRAFT_237918 [Lottia gigantea]ESP02601.1 hypothetical protein LOTGIDRAFT_237918 [Lottia gigantea]
MSKSGHPPSSKDGNPVYPHPDQQQQQQQQQQNHGQQQPASNISFIQPMQQPAYVPNTTVMVGAPHITRQAHVVVTPIKAQEKSIVDAYVLCIALGVIGAHHLYLRRPWFFVAYFCTFGLLGVGWIVDICRIPCLVKEANARIRDASREKRKQKVDAYLLWFPFGILGFHLFYLNRPAQGLLYFFTFGLCGIGWLVDLFRIPHMVNDCNSEVKVYEPHSMFASYVLCVSPFGILGLHHYYLNRPIWGILYTFTFGLLGVGWVVDWFRCYHLVIRAREEGNGKRDESLKYIDDMYVLWFPLGWLGFHHFYLRRYLWGFLYFFTFGLFGIGWLIDFCRLPCMVKEFNKHMLENKELVKQTQQHFNGQVNSRTSGDSLVTPNITPGPGQPQMYNYGATAPPPQGAYVQPGMPYPPYQYSHQHLPNVTIVQSQYGYPGPAPFQPQVHPGQPGMHYQQQNGVYQPPSYEEATHDDNTETKESRSN